MKIYKRLENSDIPSHTGSTPQTRTLIKKPPLNPRNLFRPIIKPNAYELFETKTVDALSRSVNKKAKDAHRLLLLFDLVLILCVLAFTFTENSGIGQKLSESEFSFYTTLAEHQPSFRHPFSPNPPLQSWPRKLRALGAFTLESLAANKGDL